MSELPSPLSTQDVVDQIKQSPGYGKMDVTLRNNLDKFHQFGLGPSELWVHCLTEILGQGVVAKSILLTNLQAFIEDRKVNSLVASVTLPLMLAEEHTSR